MADHQPILLARVLEEHSEMGRSFGRAFTKFAEFKTAIMTNAPAEGKSGSAIKTEQPQTDMSAPPPTQAPSSSSLQSIDAIYQSLQLELSTYSFAVDHARMVQETAREEMKKYQEKEAEIVSSIHSTTASLVDLQRELSAAQQWRSEQEEYERILSNIHALPSRSESENELQQWEQERNQLIQTKLDLSAEIESHRKSHLLFARGVQLLAREWQREEERKKQIEEEARRRQEEQQKEAHEEERRKKEEGKEDGEDEEEEEGSLGRGEDEEEEDEDEKEKRKQEMLTGSDGGVEEGEHVDDGSVMEQAASSGRVTPVAASEGQDVGDETVTAASAHDPQPETPVPMMEG